MHSSFVASREVQSDRVILISAFKTSKCCRGCGVDYDHCGMPKYVLGHHLKGEGARLELMSELLDPMQCVADAFTAVHGRTPTG